MEPLCRRLFAYLSLPDKALGFRGGGSKGKALRQRHFSHKEDDGTAALSTLGGSASAPNAGMGLQMGMGAREETLNLKDALICIDCEEVFIPQGSRCNPRCPACTSSVCVPLSSFIGTGNTLDHGADEVRVAGQDDAPARRRRMEIVHSTPIAA